MIFSATFNATTNLISEKTYTNVFHGFFIGASSPAPLVKKIKVSLPKFYDV